MKYIKFALLLLQLSSFVILVTNAEQEEYAQARSLMTQNLRTCFSTNRGNYNNDNQALEPAQFLDIPRFLFAGQSNMVGHSREAKTNLFHKIIKILNSTHPKKEKIKRMKRVLNKAEGSKPYSSKNLARLMYFMRKFLKRGRIYYGTDENAVCSYTNPSEDGALDCERNVSNIACGSRKEHNGKTGQFGPELLFAHRFPKLNTRFKGKQIGITKVAVGGTRICQWMKNSSCAEDANYWQSLVDAIQAAQGTIEAFVWFQGENDSLEEMSTEDYFSHLTEHVDDVRLEIFNASTKFEKASDVPVVIVELGAWIYGINTNVIEAQRDFAAR